MNTMACTNMDQFPSLHTYSSMLHNMRLSYTYYRCSRVLPHLHESMCGARVQSCMTTRTININTCTNMDHFPSPHSSEMLWVHASNILTPICTPRAITMLPPCYHVTFALHSNSYRQITSTYDSIDGTWNTPLSYLMLLYMYPPLSQLARFLTRCLFL